MVLLGERSLGKPWVEPTTKGQKKIINGNVIGPFHCDKQRVQPLKPNGCFCASMGRRGMGGDGWGGGQGAVLRGQGKGGRGRSGG